jgi:hypothetical protein
MPIQGMHPILYRCFIASSKHKQVVCQYNIGELSNGCKTAGPRPRQNHDTFDMVYPPSSRRDIDGRFLQKTSLRL